MPYFSKKYTKQVPQRFYFNLAILGVFFLLSIFSLSIIHRLMLYNAQKMGNALAQSYSAEEEHYITTYQTLLETSAQYVDLQIQSSSDPEYWIQQYMITLADSMGEDTINAYAVIDGAMVSANPWEGDAVYPYTKSNWYQQAVAAHGAPIFTDVYEDVMTGKPVITLAKELEREGDVLAFDIFPDDFKLPNHTQTLPEGGYYFLFDAKGTPMFHNYDGSIPLEQMEMNLPRLFKLVESDELTPERPFVYDNGQRIAIYYTVAQNGWFSVVTIPYAELTRGFSGISALYGAALMLFLLIAGSMSFREYRLNKRINRSNETIRVLGNSYYAIYRVNLQQKTYEMIKGSDYIRGKLPVEGDYNELVSHIAHMIEPSMVHEFAEHFSIYTIRNLVTKRVRDSGGDFQRLFNGSYRWVNARILLDESLSTGEAVLCFREVEEEKLRQLRQMELLKTSLENAQRSEEARNLFFSSMSHDMRTPLNAIIGLSELAQHHLENPEKLGEDMQKINFSSKQLLSLINDILELSRLEQTNFTLTHELTDLRACVESYLIPFHNQASQENKFFTAEFDLIQDKVYTDPQRIGQILNNLLSNAFKFTNEGDDIYLTLREVEHQDFPKYQIIVSDTGQGMAPEFIDQIFLPYTRETRFGATSSTGTGLGMPIVKNLVSQMGGQITVESQPGEGTTFTVTLPLKTALDDADPEQASPPAIQEPEPQILESPQPEVQPDTAPSTTSAQEELPQETPSQEPALPLAGKRILLAEDNEINMEITTEILLLNGMEVTQAWNGREALDKFKASEQGFFDAILMDMQMPELDGCQSAHAIRRLPRPDALKIPIIAVTANAFAEDVAATTAAGMNAHISKPVDFMLLQSTLEQFLLGTPEPPVPA